MGNRFASILLTIFLMYTELCVGEEYPSFHNSTPAFQYEQANFTCIAEQKGIIWDMLVIKVHPIHNTTVECALTILPNEHEELWTPLDKCISNNDTTTYSQCRATPEYGIVFQFNVTAIAKNRNIRYWCVEADREPEILAIHLIYYCDEGPTHFDHHDILTLPPMLPPIPPSEEDDTSPIPPPRPSPTMVVHPHEDVTPTPYHNIVTPEKTETTENVVTTKKPHKGVVDNKSEKDESNQDSQHEGASKEHAVTANELAVIVGPSVAALILVVVIATVIFILYKRNQLKFSGDLQGESLFSRRFSTASQVSDISVNTQPFRVNP